MDISINKFDNLTLRYPSCDPEISTDVSTLNVFLPDFDDDGLPDLIDDLDKDNDGILDVDEDTTDEIIHGLPKNTLIDDSD